MPGACHLPESIVGSSNAKAPYGTHAGRIRACREDSESEYRQLVRGVCWYAIHDERWLYDLLQYRSWPSFMSV